MIFEVIDKIAERPLLYEVFSSKDIQEVTQGYLYANCIDSEFTDHFVSLFMNFGLFVSDKFKVSSSDWGNIIRCYSNNDWESVFVCTTLVKEFQNSNKYFETISLPHFDSFSELFKMIKSDPEQFQIYSAKGFNLFLKGCDLHYLFNQKERKHHLAEAFDKLHSEMFSDFASAKLGFRVNMNLLYKHIEFNYYPQNPLLVLKEYMQIIDDFLFPNLPT